MNKLDLTREQQSKLLRMANKLFPEHKWSFESDLADNGMLDWDIDKNKWGLIHWFEFCMTHLAYTLAGVDTEDLFISDNYKVYDRVMNNENPIDYLYEEFKKLKQ